MCLAKEKYQKWVKDQVILKRNTLAAVTKGEKRESTNFTAWV